MNKRFQIPKLFNPGTAMIHICCWALFIADEISELYFLYGKLPPLYTYAIYYAINISFFYAIVILLSHSFRPPRPHYLRLIAGFLGIVAGCLLLKFVAEHFLETPGKGFALQVRFVKIFFVTNLHRLFLFLLMAVFYWSAGHIGRYKLQAMQLEKKELLVQQQKIVLESQLKSAEIAYLKQQLSPHLLFNTLNFIYSEVNACSAEATRGVLLLSGLLRYSLQSADADGKIELADEIEQIENLLALTRLRFGDQTLVSLQIEGDTGDCRVIPLLLLSLAENLVKHGDLASKLPSALIRITIAAGSLVYESVNARRPPGIHTADRHLGMRHVQMRLDSAYPGHYQLDIAEDERTYKLRLTLRR